MVSGQPPHIETYGPVRRPDKKRSRCCVPCIDHRMFLESPSASRSSKIHTATDSDHKSFHRSTVPHELFRCRSLLVSIVLWLWCLGPKHKHHPSTMCTLFDEGSSSSSAETEDSLNIWNSLLTALIHHGVGSARCLSDEELGKVALTCHFACDLLCEEMHGM